MRRDQVTISVRALEVNVGVEVGYVGIGHADLLLRRGEERQGQLLRREDEEPGRREDEEPGRQEQDAVCQARALSLAMQPEEQQERDEGPSELSSSQRAIVMPPAVLKYLLWSCLFVVGLAAVAVAVVLSFSGSHGHDPLQGLVSGSGPDAFVGESTSRIPRGMDGSSSSSIARGMGKPSFWDHRLSVFCDHNIDWCGGLLQPSKCNLTVAVNRSICDSGVAGLDHVSWPDGDASIESVDCQNTQIAQYICVYHALETSSRSTTSSFTRTGSRRRTRAHTSSSGAPSHSFTIPPDGHSMLEKPTRMQTTTSSSTTSSHTQTSTSSHAHTQTTISTFMTSSHSSPSFHTQTSTNSHTNTQTTASRSATASHFHTSLFFTQTSTGSHTRTQAATSSSTTLPSSSTLSSTWTTSSSHTRTQAATSSSTTLPSSSTLSSTWTTSSSHTRTQTTTSSHLSTSSYAQTSLRGLARKQITISSFTTSSHTQTSSTTHTTTRTTSAKTQKMRSNTITQNQNVLLLGLSIDEAVGQGWGSRIWMVGAMHERFVNRLGDSVLVVPRRNLLTYNRFNLSPPAIDVPYETFWNTYKPTSPGVVAGMLHAEVLGTWPRVGVESLADRWLEHASTKTRMFQDLAGCWQDFDIFMWQMFLPLMQSYKQPFPEYIGMHIRHGDKINEGRTIDLAIVMGILQGVPAWKSMRNVFVATDDANVLSREISKVRPPPPPPNCLMVSGGCYKIRDETCLFSWDGRIDTPEIGGYPVYGQPCVWCDGPGGCNTGNICEPYGYLASMGQYNMTQARVSDCPAQTAYSWNWTEFYRHPGGEPDTCEAGFCYHSSSPDFIRAVLQDTMGLAHAAVMVGSFNSNFFKIAWLLNYLRRTPEQRLEKWCFDAFSNTPCHDRHDFVVEFLDEALKAGVPYLPDVTDALRFCQDPVFGEG